MLVLNAGVFPPSAPHRRALGRSVAAGHGGQRRRQPLAAASVRRPARARSPRLGRVVVNASKNVHAPGPGRRGLLRVEGVAHPAGTRRRARVGVEGHPGQHRAPQRGVRHRHLGRGDARVASRELRPHRRRVPQEQPARRRGRRAPTSRTSSSRCAHRRSRRPPPRRSPSTAATSASSEATAVLACGWTPRCACMPGTSEAPPSASGGSRTLTSEDTGT